MKERGTAKGPNVMYFETGQGSELSSDAYFGTDQVTMEARCYAYVKQFNPFMVNTVVGFIGPEYLYDSKQVLRADLEDHFMGKLTGIPVGCDCCYTNHMQADQNDLESLTLMLGAAGCNYVIGVPAMDAVSECLGAEVTCVLLGERPGLATANSMSAYISYKASVGMPEARRTVVSNIHSGGIPAVEAGAHIAGLLKTILERKQSGVDLQL